MDPQGVARKWVRGTYASAHTLIEVDATSSGATESELSASIVSALSLGTPLLVTIDSHVDALHPSLSSLMSGTVTGGPSFTGWSMRRRGGGAVRRLRRVRFAGESVEISDGCVCNSTASPSIPCPRDADQNVGHRNHLTPLILQNTSTRPLSWYYTSCNT